MEWICKECLVRPLCETPCEKFLKGTKPTLRNNTTIASLNCTNYYQGPLGAVPFITICIGCGAILDPRTVEKRIRTGEIIKL